MIDDLSLVSPVEKAAGPMTHKQLVRRMSNWLRNSKGYSVVIAELATRNSETPDVLGFHAGASMMIECKVSRSDFLADREKRFRRCEELGMGDQRVTMRYDPFFQRKFELPYGAAAAVCEDLVRRGILRNPDTFLMCEVAP